MSVGGVKKLLPNLSNKNKYILYYRTLQLYLQLGIKLEYWRLINHNA